MTVWSQGVDVGECEERVGQVFLVGMWLVWGWVLVVVGESGGEAMRRLAGLG